MTQSSTKKRFNLSTTLPVILGVDFSPKICQQKNLSQRKHVGFEGVIK